MNNLLKTVGNTPLIKLEKISQELKANIYAKAEFFNPGGSIKDRIALSMVEDALEKGEVKHIVEPTSGNTGIGLAFICALKGIKLTIVMPESMSVERRAAILQYGAELILTPANLGMNGSIKKAQEIVEKSGAVMLNQFENSANPKAHYQHTGPEIYSEIKNIDIFIAGVGTGGTISGVGKYLKEQNSSIEAIAIEPSESAVISGKEKGIHKIEGIGAGFIPKNLNLDIIDKTVTVSSQEAIDMAKKLAKEEALFVGISSGANIAGVYNLAKQQDIKGKNIITVLPDSACRYLSTELFK